MRFSLQSSGRNEYADRLAGWLGAEDAGQFLFVFLRNCVIPGTIARAVLVLPEAVYRGCFLHDFYFGVGMKPLTPSGNPCPKPHMQM